MIKKIINHRHIKTLASLLVVVGLLGYASNYKKSEAFEYSTYLYNVNISSNNVSEKSIAVAGDTVTLSFEVYDTQVLSNLTATIYGKPATVACNYIGAPLTFNFVEVAYAQFYDPSECKATITITAEDVSSMPSIISTLPFEIKFTQIIFDDGTQASFIATNTDDGSQVTVKRPAKTSDYISNVHIEATTPSDITLASANNKVNVTYYINDYFTVSNHKGIILDKEAKIICELAKEGIPAESVSSATATPATAAQSSIKFPKVIIDNQIEATSTATATPVQIPADTSAQSTVKGQIKNDLIPATINTNTEAEAQVKRSTLEDILPIIPADMPASILNSFVESAYAQVKEGEPKEGGFVGPARCIASVDVTQAEIDETNYNFVPFTISMIITTSIDKSEIKIENVTDKSFVRISKNTVAIPAPVEVVPVAGGILAVGLISAVPTTVIPQNTLIKDNNVNTIDTTSNLDANGKCIPIKGFYKIGDVNPEIKKIKTNINKSMGMNLILNNKFDKEMFVALKAWQEKYRDTVLDPWEMESPSGYFYKTSNWSMNYQSGCEVPKFVLEKYKNR